MKNFESVTAATLLSKIEECQIMSDWAYQQMKAEPEMEERFAYWVGKRNVYVELAVELYGMNPHDVGTESFSDLTDRVQKELKEIAGE